MYSHNITLDIKQKDLFTYEFFHEIQKLSQCKPTYLYILLMKTKGIHIRKGISKKSFQTKTNGIVENGNTMKL